MTIFENNPQETGKPPRFPDRGLWQKNILLYHPLFRIETVSATDSHPLADTAENPDSNHKIRTVL